MRMPLPPPPCAALIISGKPIRAASRASSCGDLVGAGVAGHHRHARGLHQFLGAGLAAHLAHRRRLRADEDDAGGLDRIGEVGVLAEEAVTGMDRLRAGLAGRPRGSRRRAGSCPAAAARRSGTPRRPGARAARRRRPRNTPRRCGCRACGRCGSRGRRSRRGWRSGLSFRIDLSDISRAASGAMADRFDIVAIRIEHERAVIVRVRRLRAQAGLPPVVVRAPCGQRPRHGRRPRSARDDVRPARRAGRSRRGSSPVPIQKSGLPLAPKAGVDANRCRLIVPASLPSPGA